MHRQVSDTRAAAFPRISGVSIQEIAKIARESTQADLVQGRATLHRGEGAHVGCGVAPRAGIRRRQQRQEGLRRQGCPAVQRYPPVTALHQGAGLASPEPLAVQLQCILPHS